MSNDTKSIFEIFIADCDCDNCAEKRKKPSLFANVIRRRSGTYIIDTASKDHQHLRDVEFTSVFDAKDAIEDNGLTFVCFIS